MSSLQSLIQTGTKLWLDSIDPELVQSNRQLGATGATSNPVIIANLIKTGRFDDLLLRGMRGDLDDEAIAWQVTDRLVRDAQQVFHDVWQKTSGDDGYVSFELDPLLEDAEQGLSHSERVERYVALGRQWSAGHDNRMIKVPATAAGLDSLEELAASGVTLNVTLLFTNRQYLAARDAIWRGARRHGRLERFKSVYSIFVSRVDVYAAQHMPQLSAAAKGQVGIVNAKRIWAANRDFWRANVTPLRQEIIFASTGTKDPADAPWKYVEAFAGSDIETNPPETNEAVQASGRQFSRHVDTLPAPEVLTEIDRVLDEQHMEATLMSEGVKKFADPQKSLLALIRQKRQQLMQTATQVGNERA
jgi:transaldolase